MFRSPALSNHVYRPLKNLRLLSLFTLGSSILSSASAQTYKTFDPPKSTYTAPSLITQEGQVVGFYYSNGPNVRGFVRSPEGKYTTFAFPETTGSLYSLTGLNAQGTIVGTYLIPPVDRYTVFLPFVRKSDGKLTTIEIPKSCVKPPDCIGNYGLGINNSGTILGQYEDDNFLDVGFILGANGKLTSFKVPSESIAGQNYGTHPASYSGMNKSGAITGSYTAAADGTSRGFLRAPDGKFTTFSVSGASSGPDYGTFPLSMNDDGAITGYFTDGKDGCRGFIRSREGKVTVFAPSDLAPGICFLVPASINPSGTITGYYTDTSYVVHSFVRTAAGDFTSFEVPGANTQTSDFEGTFAVSINPAGVITGYWNDKSGNTHGFIRTP
jgi:hypothetical protein